MLVFCKNCKHNSGRFKSEAMCCHRNNLSHDWFSDCLPVKECCEINANNNCPWYESYKSNNDCPWYE